MSKYAVQPLDFTGLSTIPIADRGGKVQVQHMGAAPQKQLSLSQWMDRLPRILAADSLRAVVHALVEAKRKQRGIFWGMGGHVIKCGLAPAFVDLMDRGYVSGLVMNGAAAIHDFEIGIAGCTSEDVESVLPDGRFGTAEETGREINQAFADAHRDGIGLGEALGRHLERLVQPEFADACLLYQAWKRSIPVTVHVAVGTDTPHTYPQADGAAIGAGTHHDFKLFCSLVRQIDDGGAYLNVGSAVVLPEVFLKAVSVVRNLGYSLGNFTTVNFDFLQHYRPRVNVVDRPHAKTGGKGYALTGHHEIMIPLLAAILADYDA